jgi:sterol desaturase/sphingolipid hydroxylase (fatty acid hydroxylase superfamily)
MIFNWMSPARRIDFGKRAGVMSGLFGVLVVLAQLCFLFPDILVSKDLRPFYHEHLPIFRMLLQIVTLATIALGLSSVLILRSKAHGVVGICLGVLVLLMGGWNVQFIPTGELKLTVGLDYFVLELFVLGLLFIPMERLWTLKEQKIFRKGWQTDLKHFFVSHAGVQFLSFLTLIPVQMAFAFTRDMHYRDYIASLPVWLQFFMILFCVDMVSYWVHRAFHTVPALWKFHAIHHSSLHMDWLAGSRTHIVDSLINRTLGFVPIFVLGFSAGAIYAYLAFVSFHAVYIHANVRHRWPGLRWIFATPEFHHWHHTSDEEGIDKNFAVFLSFIDVLFRTAHLPSHWPKAYGTTKWQPPETYLGQLAYPFKKQDDTPYG